MKTREIITKDLTNSKNWELDGYCPNLNIAFEYQGYPSHWDVSQKYNKVSLRDKLKNIVII